MTWFSPDLPRDLPYDQTVLGSRFKLLGLFCDDPGLLWRIVAKGLDCIRVEGGGMIYHYMGQVEGERFARARHPTIGNLPARLPPGAAHRSLFLVPLVLVAVCLVGLALGKNMLCRGLALLVVVSGLIIYSCLLTTVLGDGYSEVSRHMHLAFNFVVVQYLAFALLVAIALARILARAVGIGRRLAIRGKPATHSAQREKPAVAPGAPEDEIAAAPRPRVVGPALSTIGFVVGTFVAALVMHRPPEPFALSPGQSIQELPGAGLVEAVAPDQHGNCRMSGWACDPRTKQHPARLLLAYDGQMVPASVFLRGTRPDVSAAPGLAKLVDAGWEAFVPRRFLMPGKTPDVIVVLSDGTVGKLAIWGKPG
jgi:hypothetical protein